MVWYNLKIGNWTARYTPINPKKEQFEDCDSDGNVLKRVSGTYTKGHYENENGERFETAFKLIKGNPRAKFSKTKEVNSFKEVDLKECDELIIERQYLVECDGLLEELKTTGKALKFGFTAGNGFKVYFAYLKPSNYDGFLEMVCGTTNKNEVILNLIEGIQAKQKVKEITATIEGVERAKVEDLLEL